MSDGMDELKDLIRHQQGQRQIGATNQVVSELQRQNEILQRQNQALQPKGPPCPFCGGDLSMRNAEVCKHCRKDLAWVQGVPCKPGQERQLRAKLEEKARIKALAAAAEREEFNRTIGSASKRYHELHPLMRFGNFSLVAMFVCWGVSFLLMCSGIAWGAIVVFCLPFALFIWYQIQGGPSKLLEYRSLIDKYGATNLANPPKVVSSNRSADSSADRKTQANRTTSNKVHDSKYHVTCTLCGEKISFRAKHFGKTIKCNVCHTKILLPSPRDNR